MAWFRANVIASAYFQKTALAVGVCLWLLLCGGYAQAQSNPYFPPGQVPQIVATPPPPWSAGQVVTFSIVIDNFQFGAASSGASWFSALGYDVGGCWTNFTPGPPPFSYSGGNWIYVQNPSAVAACGFPPQMANCPAALPGWYIDQPTNSPNGTIDGIPCNNYGDTPTPGPWTFTWTAQVPNPKPTGCDLSMGVKVYGDGEIGTYGNIPDQTQYPCGQDLIFYSVAISGDPIVCSSTDYTLTLKGNIPANAVFIKDFDGGVLVSGGDPGPYVVQWATPGMKNVSIQVIDPANGLPVGTSDLMVEVVPYPTTDFIISNYYPAFGCDTVTVVYTGNQPDTAIYEWNFDFNNTGNVEVYGNPTGQGPFKLVYKQPGNYVVILENIDNGVCKSADEDSTQFFIQVKKKPGTEFTVSKNVVCENEPLTVTFTDPDVSGTFYSWNFDSAFPLPNATGTGTGLGPFQVSWNSAGTKQIVLNVTYPGCPKSDTVSVLVLPSPTAFAGTDVLKCNDGLPVTIDSDVIRFGTCTYQWTTLNGAVVSTDMKPTFTPTADTTYYILRAVCDGCVSNLDTVRVVNTPAPTAHIANPQIFVCAGVGGGVIPATATGGTGALFYNWKPALGLSSTTVLNPVANPTGNTTYTLLVTDSMGCAAAEVTAEVVVVATPIADAGNNLVICTGSNNVYQLNGSVANPAAGETYAFEWSPATGLSCTDCPNPVASPTSAQIYTLKVKGVSSGCESQTNTDKSRAVVYVYNQPTANIGAENLVLCDGDPLVIGDVPYGAGPDYTYFWQPGGETTQTITVNPTTTTTYTLIVESNGCQSEPASVTVTVSPKPQPDIPVDTVFVCPGQSAQIPAVDPGVPASPDITYHWLPKTGLSDPSSPAPFANPAKTTTYTVTVHNGECTGRFRDSVVVYVSTPPQIKADSSGKKSYTYCRYNHEQAPWVTGQITSTDIYPYTFKWIPETAVSNPDTLSPQLIPDSTQYVYLEVTLQPSGCVFRDSVMVQVQPDIKIDVDTLNDITRLCGGDSSIVVLRGDRGGAIYEWNPSAGVKCMEPRCRSVVLKPATTTNYTITANEGYCTDSTVLRIEAYRQPKADFVATETFGCEKASIIFLSETINALGFFWDFGDGNFSNEQNPIHQYDKVGVYDVSLIVVNSGGTCADTIVKPAYIEIKELPEADFESKPTIEETVADSLIIPEAWVQFTDITPDSVVAWHWIFGDSTASDERNPRHNFQFPGEFEVQLIITNAQGCVDTVSKGKYMVVYPTLEPIPNVFTPNGDGKNDLFGPSYYGTKPVSIRVFDRWGLELYADQKGWNGVLPSGKEAPTGVYFYEIKIGDRFYRGNVTLLR